jgi:predicted RND superfamily exporter protein
MTNGAGRHRGTVTLTLASITVVLIAAQFALAGFGAFTMDKTPADNAYGPHMVLGVVIGAVTWLTLAAVLASRATRARHRTVWLAVTLAVLAIPVEPLLGEAAQHVPALGALHALTGLAIFVLAGWLAGETGRHRAAAQREPAAAGHERV